MSGRVIIIDEKDRPIVIRPGGIVGVSGTLAVDNTVNVDGTVSVDNTVNVDGTVALANTTVNFSLRHTDNIFTTTLKTIDQSHHEIHEGNHFFINNHMDLPNGGSIAFLIETHATVACHLFWEFKNEVEAEYLVKREITYNTLGATVGPENNNQNSATISNMIVSTNPLTVTGGATIGDHRLGSGRDEGGASRVDREIVLKKSSNYYFKFTNRTLGTTNLLNWEFYWYEV